MNHVSKIVLQHGIDYARQRAAKTGKAYGLGGLIVTPSGDIVRPSGGRMITGAIPQRGRKMHTAGCHCGACPTPTAIAAGGGSIMTPLNRVAVGRGGKCDYAPLSFSFLAVAAGAAAPALNQNSTVTICPEKMVLVSSGTAGFLITDLRFGNRRQFAELTAGAGLHSDLFSPNAEQAIPFKGDCIDSGTPVQMAVTNLDGVNAQSLFGMFIGPMQGM